MEQDDAALLWLRLLGVDHCRSNDIVDMRIITELGWQQAGRMFIGQQLMYVRYYHKHTTSQSKSVQNTKPVFTPCGLWGCKNRTCSVKAVFCYLCFGFRVYVVFCYLVFGCQYQWNLLLFFIHSFVFTARAYARAVLGVVILCVRPSVRLSVTRVGCDKTKWRTADIFIPHERAITLLLIPTVVGRRRPLPSEICAQSDPPTSKNPDFDRFPSITSQP